MTIEELEQQLDAKTDDSRKLWNAFARDAQECSTPLFSVSPAPTGYVLRLAGSGTLLTHGGEYYILTASHVWHEGLKASAKVGVVLRESYDHRCLIDTASLAPYEVSKPPFWNEWGPDVIMLKVPAARVGEVKAFRTFHSMDWQERAKVSCDRNETYLMVGTPSALGTFSQNHASVELLANWVGLPSPTTKAGWDYLDASFRLDTMPNAQSFGGMSGGGLWRVQVYASAAGTIEAVSILEGVAFYELGTQNGTGVIRCHGPKSIARLLECLPPQN